MPNKKFFLIFKSRGDATRTNLFAQPQWLPPYQANVATNQDESEEAGEQELGDEDGRRRASRDVRFVPPGIVDRVWQLARPDSQQQRRREHKQAVVEQDSIFAWREKRRDSLF